MHLMKVACGLESMIVGEDQILGQIKEMYPTAWQAGVTGKVLDDLTHAITNKVLAEPTKTLRNAAEEEDIDFLETTAALFKLDTTEE